MSLEDQSRELAEIIKDYRHFDEYNINKEHVLRWVAQFREFPQETILSELIKNFTSLYASQDRVTRFLNKLITNEELTSGSPKNFWSKASLLDLQTRSQSQQDMTSVFSTLLSQKLGISPIYDPTSVSRWIYLDDGIFSGNQVKSDLESATYKYDLQDGELHVITMCLYQSGNWELERFRRNFLKSRKITLKIWAAVDLENRLTYKDSSDVLWPKYEDVTTDALEALRNRNFYVDQIKYRSGTSVGKKGIFSSNASRRILEHAFFEKGAEICTFPQNPSTYMRPLGYTGFRNQGFGNLFVTYRNCPNNAPLVLWWGDPEGNPTLRQWYPLLQRRVRPDNREGAPRMED